MAKWDKNHQNRIKKMFSDVKSHLFRLKIEWDGSQIKIDQNEKFVFMTMEHIHKYFYNCIGTFHQHNPSWDENFQKRMIGFNKQNKEYVKWQKRQEDKKKSKKGIKESVFSYDLMNK